MDKKTKALINEESSFVDAVKEIDKHADIQKRKAFGRFCDNVGKVFEGMNAAEIATYIIQNDYLSDKLKATCFTKCSENTDNPGEKLMFLHYALMYA